MHATEFKLLIVNFSIVYIMHVFTLISWQSNCYNLKMMITKVLFSKDCYWQILPVCLQKGEKKKPWEASIRSAN